MVDIERKIKSIIETLEKATASIKHLLLEENEVVQPLQSISRDDYGVYMIICRETRKLYCGKGIIYNRIHNHFSNLRNGNHKGEIQDDFNRYGEDSFEYKIVYIATHKNDPFVEYTEKVLTNVLRLTDPKYGYNNNNYLKGFSHNQLVLQSLL